MRSRNSMTEAVQGAGTSDGTRQRLRWTWRNVAAAALLVYASTFVWMTAAFAGTKRPPGGAAWALANAGALAGLALFALAGWGVFKSRPWSERAAAARQMDIQAAPAVKAIFWLRAIPSLLQAEPFRPQGSGGIVAETLGQGVGRAGGGARPGDRGEGLHPALA
jgi:membrane protease YdiL (CAAX protease family)